MTRFGRFARRAAVVLAALALLSLVASGAGAWRMMAGLTRLQTLASQAAQTGTVPWSALRSTAQEVRIAAHVTRIASLPWRPALDAAVRLRVLPPAFTQVGPLLDLAAPLADAGVVAIGAADVVAHNLEPAGPGDALPPLGGRLTRALDAAAPDLAALRPPFAAAARARAALRLELLTGRLAPAQRAVQAYDLALGSHPAVADLIVEAPAAWRWLSGADTPRTYRVLGQNRDELRATGGFLATAGEVTVERGAVTRVQQGNPTELDDPRRTPTEPPRPLREFMGLGSWLLQDANWWADFPTAAAQADTFWRQGAPSSGTLAADDGALIRLTAALGPLRLPGVAEPVTAATLRDLIASNVYAGAADHSQGQAIQERKSQFLAQLFAALLGAALDPPPDRRVALATAVLDAFRHKELLLTLSEPRWAAALHDLGWDGHLNQEGGDLLYLVETTASYTKLARRMQTDLTYDVQLDERAAVRRAKLTLRVRNNFSSREVPSMYPSFYFGIWWNPVTRREETHLGRYAGYYRLYVPQGTVLLDGSGWDAPLDYVPRETNRTVIGGYLVVDPGQSREVTLDLVPPPDAGAPAGEYRLSVPRQPSAPPRSVQVRLGLPAGLGARTASGSAGQGTPERRRDSSGRSWLEWRAVSDTDLSFVADVAFTG